MFKASRLAVAVILGWVVGQVAPANAYDLDNGNAAIDVVIMTVAPVIFTEVSPSGGDATLVLRTTTQITNAWFDATAPYHPTAVGVYTRLGRQPAPATNYNMNVALLYASYRVLNTILPKQQQIWRDMLTGVGLDPDDASTELTTPIGIGNVAGMGVVQGRERDGMNQIGDEDGRTYNPVPYMDYTAYKPVNTAYTLYNPSRWQPDLQRQGMGIYKIQQFVTPQYALTEPYSYADPRKLKLRVPPPKDSNHRRFHDYKRQADEVLQASADLNDERKSMASLFDNKILALGFSAVHAALSRGLSLREFIDLDFLTNMAAFDAGIFVWQEKRRFDAVRPFSAIRYIYGDGSVTAWGGPGQGTVHLPASEWKSYLEEADHPEYPSASTCFCHAHTQSARLYLGDDVLNWDVPQPAGSSLIEPGITPASDIVLHFDTWTDFAADCGQSRVWAGVHFQAAVDASARVCDVFGDMAYDYLTKLIDGTAPERGPSMGLGDKPKHGHGPKHH